MLSHPSKIRSSRCQGGLGRRGRDSNTECHINQNVSVCVWGGRWRGEQAFSFSAGLPCSEKQKLAIGLSVLIVTCLQLPGSAAETDAGRSACSCTRVPCTSSLAARNRTPGGRNAPGQQLCGEKRGSPHLHVRPPPKKAAQHPTCM